MYGVTISNTCNCVPYSQPRFHYCSHSRQLMCFGILVQLLQQNRHEVVQKLKIHTQQVTASKVWTKVDRAN